MFSVEAAKHPPRLAICGSASVGKTTLVHALAGHLQLPWLREEMRDYLEATRVELWSLPSSQVETILLELWRKRLQQECAATAFVADNCPMDFAASALYYGCLSATGEDALITRAAPHLDQYDAIVVLPWGVLPYQQDGIRPADQFLQLRYQVLLEGLLHRYVDPQKLHFLPKSLLTLEERVRWVTARLGERVNAVHAGQQA